MSQENLQSRTVQTTGHAWDGDLQEYNNPLPTWWVWAFYASVAIAVIYWLIYPAWPIGKTYTKGFDTITYVNDKGVQKTTHWNTRAQLMQDMNAAAVQQKVYLNKIDATPFEKIARDPEMTGFIASAGKALFSDNCAACHQAGGQGKVGFFPNLTDDDWLYGGTFAQIQQTITHGRNGYMPPFNEVLDGTQIDNLASYILGLSGEKVDVTKAAAGDVLFHSETAACFYCHGDNAKGRQEIGSANLADQIWLWADVPGQKTLAAKQAVVKQVILNGLNKGVMPAWKDRLSAQQIKLLTVYIHELGGGK